MPEPNHAHLPASSSAHFAAVSASRMHYVVRGRVTLKVQVKTQEKAKDGGPTDAYVKPADYEYWTLLALPVIICRPVLSTGKVYWLPASKGRRTGEGVAFDFQTAPELRADSAGALRDLSSKKGETFDLLRGLAERVERSANYLLGIDRQQHLAQEKEFYAEYDALVGQAVLARQLAEAFPSLLTPRGKSTLERLQDTTNRVNGLRRWMETNRD